MEREKKIEVLKKKLEVLKQMAAFHRKYYKHREDWAQSIELRMSRGEEFDIDEDSLQVHRMSADSHRTFADILDYDVNLISGNLKYLESLDNGNAKSNDRT